eukprot:GDKJ01015967.1.p1 GENE.GDKJ01015967.1~~GDKJ01015967.1.p1  ORF type:complete len:317 (+),score=36.24 GDKJ01015967.1:53-952(+)
MEKLATFAHPFMYHKQPHIRGLNPLTRRDIHVNGIWHSSVHVWLQLSAPSSQGMMFQKRSKLKDTYPEHWDISCAGHMDAESTPYETVIRELGEELNISVMDSEESKAIPTFIVSPSILDAPPQCGECEDKVKSHVMSYLQEQDSLIEKRSVEFSPKINNFKCFIHDDSQPIKIFLNERQTLEPAFVSLSYSKGGISGKLSDCEIQFVYVLKINFETDDKLEQFMRNVAMNAEPGEVESVAIIENQEMFNHWTNLLKDNSLSFHKNIREWNRSGSSVSSLNKFTPRHEPYLNAFRKVLF